MEDNKTSPANINNNSSPAPESLPPPDNAPAPVTPVNNKKKLSLSAIVAVIAVIILGGSAAAYFGIIVPGNKPENVLKKAIANTSEQTQSKFSGKFSFESLDPAAEIKAVTIDFNGQSDIENNAFQIESEVTASGVKVPVEVRGLDGSLYIKLGDLRGIKSVVQLSAPEYAPVVDIVSDKVAERWMEIDETLSKQVGSGCTLNMSSFALNEDDLELLSRRYDEVPFMAVQNSSSDTVNGRPAIKYQLEIDDNKAAEFGSGIQELSVIKKIKECGPNDDNIDTSNRADDDVTPLTIWVDKGNKRITKLASQTTEQDENNNKARGSFEVTLEYGQADISKPDGARPITEVIGEVYGELLQSGGADNPLLQDSLPVLTD